MERRVIWRGRREGGAEGGETSLLILMPVGSDHSSLARAQVNVLWLVCVGSWSVLGR